VRIKNGEIVHDDDSGDVIADSGYFPPIIPREFSDCLFKC